MQTALRIFRVGKIADSALTTEDDDACQLLHLSSCEHASRRHQATVRSGRYRLVAICFGFVITHNGNVTQRGVQGTREGQSARKSQPQDARWIYAQAVRCLLDHEMTGAHRIVRFPICVQTCEGEGFVGINLNDRHSAGFSKGEY